jgi:hypothetical protein
METMETMETMQTAQSQWNPKKTMETPAPRGAL